MNRTIADAGAFQRRAFWLKQLHQWHWVSSAVCLIGMLLFAITGITLNHASAIETTPQVTTQQGTLPTELRPLIDASATESKAGIPDAVSTWIAETMSVSVAGREVEWNPDEVYISLPRPGGDAWLSIGREDGIVRYERTDRGWIAYLNDLHKGRNTGTAWKWFLDLFAVACVVFTITGLFLLKLHAGNRPTTWPMVGLGLVIPLLLAILFIH
jgi:uncharacterized protein